MRKRINRTIVGLKDKNSYINLPFTVKYQSHHSGIESEQDYLHIVWWLRINRTIVGLKAISSNITMYLHQRINRTIVGLKVNLNRVLRIMRKRINRTIVGLKELPQPFPIHKD